MSTNLYDAHRQWATRPADERFENFESLQVFTENRKKSSVESERALKDVNLKILEEGSIAINGNSPPANLSHWAFSQLCYSVGAPVSRGKTQKGKCSHNFGTNNKT